MNWSEKSLTVTSSVLFVIPTLYAFSVQQFWYGALALCIAALSASYHSVKDDGPHWWWDATKPHLQRYLLILDTVAALLLVAYALVLFQTGGFHAPFVIAVLLFFPLLVQFLIPIKRFYKFQHALWHAGTACIALLPLL